MAFLIALRSQRLFSTVGVIVAYAVLVVIVFTVAEVIPKTLAALAPSAVALLAARPVSWLTRIVPVSPISRLLIGVANVVVPGRGLAQGPFVSELELLGIVGAAADDEVIELEEQELIASVLEFGDTMAREVMVPRLDMLTVPAGMSVRESLDSAIEHGYSRLPVVGATSDDVVGVVYAKDLMRIERVGSGHLPVDAFVRPARFVPATTLVARLMRDMQASKSHMAILVDEYGGIAGLVTLEDCLEELVGDIVDEYDVETEDFVDLGNGTFVVDGAVTIGDFNDARKTALPDDDWDTIGGMVFGLLGHVPVVGETITFQGWELTVAYMDGRRVARVRAKAANAAEFEPEATS